MHKLRCGDGKWLTQSGRNHPGALLFLAYAYNDGGDNGTEASKKTYLSYLFKAAGAAKVMRS